MKRLNFKNEFKSHNDIKGLIPENYKFDGHTFLMTDGNQTYKVRWDDKLNEGTILQYENKQKINEDKERINKLFNFKSSDTVKKTNSYINETVEFKNMMDVIRKKTINESINPQDIMDCLEKAGGKNLPKDTSEALAWLPSTCKNFMGMPDINEKCLSDVSKKINLSIDDVKDCLPKSMY
jgi:hypothetical protein